MAEIRPFRALRYDPAKVKLDDVITQPYDKITPAMQQAYLDRSAANFIRFELPPAGADPYAGAREFLAQTRRSGFIKLEEDPAIYVYDQFFTDPLQQGRGCMRRSIIVLGRLHDYSDGVIFRHEQTLTAPKRDREDLLKTTRVQSGLLFMMYDDPSRTVESLQPDGQVAEFTDDLGVRQRMWAVTDPSAIANIQRAINALPLFIADGHHRYETALSLRRSREGRYAEDFAMMALVNIHSEGLVVLPTHRVLFGISAERFRSGLDGLFATFGARPLNESDGAGLYERLAKKPQQQFAMAVITAEGARVIEIDRAEMQADFPEIQCDLDVEALHGLLEKFFGVTPADVTAQKYVRYHRHAADAVRDVASGAQAAFLIRPVTVEKIRERSLRGALMPQKSTDFYPKMNSGLTLYSWDESFADPTLPKAGRVGHPSQV